jgi:hypothetical protein
VTTDEAFTLLAEQLDGREPRFVVERLFEKGTVAWDEDRLPLVYVSPDVGEALRKRVPARCLHVIASPS